MFTLAIVAALAASPVAADPAVAEITRLEQQWGQAFVTRDFRFIERLVAPQYRLVGARSDGKYDITRRAEWMKNARAFTSHAFAVETVDVNRVGNTAVASAQGVWTVSRRPGEAPRATRFFVTDTWVRRGGQWQVIHRYSHRLPDAAWPPVMPASRPTK
jgi:ketosteroid isomerase-like protein